MVLERWVELPCDPQWPGPARTPDKSLTACWVYAKFQIFTRSPVGFYWTPPAAFRSSISVIRRSPHTLPIDSVLFVPSPPRPASAPCTGRRLCSAWLEATGPASYPSTSSWPCGESKTTSTDKPGRFRVTATAKQLRGGGGSALSGASLKTTALALFESEGRSPVVF